MTTIMTTTTTTTTTTIITTTEVLDPRTPSEVTPKVPGTRGLHVSQG